MTDETPVEATPEVAPELNPEEESAKEAEVEAKEETEEEKMEDFKKRQALFITEFQLLCEKYQVGLNIVTTNIKK